MIPHLDILHYHAKLPCQEWVTSSSAIVQRNPHGNTKMSQANANTVLYLLKLMTTDDVFEDNT